MKKIIVLFCTIFVFFLTVVFGQLLSLDTNMVASTNTDPFYGPGDIFEQTKKSTFTMGGYEWSIAYADQSTGKGFIWVDPAEGTYYLFNKTNLDNTIANHQALYKTNLNNAEKNDVIGNEIKNNSKNDVSDMHLMDFNEYIKITENESNMKPVSIESGFQRYAFLINPADGQITNIAYFIRAGLGCSSFPVFPGTKSICVENRSSPTARVGLTYVFEVELPSKFYMELSDLKPTNGYSYKDVKANTNVAKVDIGVAESTTVSLEKNDDASGITNAYQNFELIDPDGNPIDVISSIGFKQDYKLRVKANAPDLVNGSLRAGTYSFDLKLATTGGKTVQETFTVVVKKAKPNLSFADSSKLDVKIGDSIYSSTITTDISDSLSSSNVSFMLTGGVSNVLTLQYDASNPLVYKIDVSSSHTGIGLPTTFTLSAITKETENYDAASIERSIYVYKEISSLVWTPVKDGFTTSDVAVSGITIGSLAVKDGVSPYTYELVKTTDDKYDPVKGADNALFTISNESGSSDALVKTSSALTAKTYNIQFKATDAKNKSVYANGTISVSTKGQPALNFKNTVGGTIISSLKVKYDDASTHLIAEGGAIDNSNSIVYGYAPDSMQGGVSPKDYATINTSNGLITPLRTGTIKVQAKRPGNATYDDVVTYMDLTIEPAEQVVTFNDASSMIQIKEGASKRIDATGTIKSSGLPGVGSIIYSVSDTAVATVNSNTGDLTAIKAGTITLTATMNKTGESGYDSNYDTVTATKTIKVYKGKSIDWNASVPNIKANSNAVGNKVGTLTVSDYASDPGFAVSTNSTDQNVDASFFKVVDNGTSAEVQLAKTISATDWVNHNGTFKVQVEVSDSNGTETKDIIVTIDESDNDVYFTEGGYKITSLTKKYGENDNEFILTSKTDGLGVTYSVVNESDNVLEVLGTGAVTIQKVGTTTVQVVAGSGNGYAQRTVTMPVTIEQGTQSIAFIDSATVKRQFVENSKFSEAAILKETTKNTESSRSITYTSNSPSVCSITSDGEVTMLAKGLCDITASNSDSDWTTATVNKQINLYDKMNLTYTAISPNIKAEANAIGDKVGTINVSEHQSAPSYKISTNSTTQNADASFFQIIGNGAIADLKLAKAISASDCSNHGGSFKVQVEVTDINGTQTIDIVVVIDEAENVVNFTEDGKIITSLTKKFGENNNSFHLYSTSSNAGGATYSVSPDPNSVLDVSGTGVVTVKSSGTATVQVLIASGNGYAQKAVTMPITISSGDQGISFKDTTTLNRAFAENETFRELAELKETSKNSLSTRTITYTSNDTSVCTIDAAGSVTMHTKGICDITASNRDPNWTAVTVNKKINLYDGMGVSFTANGNPQAETVTTNAGAKAGSLTVNGGLDPKTFAISTASDAKNKDASYFQVNSSGIVSFKKTIMATDLVGKYNSTKKVYELFVQLETTDSLNTKVTTDAIVEIKGAPLKAEFNTNGTGKVTEEYGPGKTFTLDLASNKGKGIPTYQLKNDTSMPSDVLDSVDASGLVTIQHANDPSFVGNPLMVEAVIPASNGYDEETIEVEVEITKAPQPDFAFKTPNIKLGHGASITPFFNGNISNGTITMTSGNNALATISGSDIKAKTTDGSVVVTAINSGNRDYKSATATANVTISSAPAYDFVISVPAATYGDTGLKADIVLNGASGANQAQTWSSSDPTIADIDADKNITIKKAGTVTITCVQTSTGEPSVTATAVMVIDPKPIIVTVNDASKYVGEAVPTFSAVIPTADLVGSDTLGQPTFSCKDGTALVKPDTKAGTYDINGTYPTASYPNYAITVKKGKLTIKQDASLPEWFHLEGATSKTTLDGTKWVNEDVNVVLDSAAESAGTYDEISLDNTLWGTTQTISKEGNTTSNVYFRINASKIIATSQSTSVKIDKTKPVVKSITGTPANRNALSELLNSLTFGTYFKPKYEVSIIAEDVLPKDVKENSKLRSIQYNVYQLKDDSTLSEPIASGEMKSGDTLKLVDEGKYMVCAIALDNAGNQSAELCSGIRIKSMGESSDGKELPDINIDIDGDGIADINITRPGEKKPYLNIDTDGDGKPDINISRDGEKVIPGTTKPFLNIISDETPWKAEKEIDFDKDGKPDFRTNGSLEPVMSLDSNNDNIPDLNIDLDGDDLPDINIDIDGDNIPDTNIDSDGDGKPDINIDKTGTGKPQERICTNVVWDPITMVKKAGEIIYGTTSGLKPDSKDSLTDNGIIIKPSNPGSIFLPNYALKVEDVTKNIESTTKNQIIEITGPDSEVKQVFDVSLSDGEKVIQPDGSILVRIPIDNSIKNPRVLLRNKLGIFEEVEVSLEDGYYVFETDYLGQVSIVGDKEQVVDPSDPKEPTPTPTPDPTPTNPSTTKPNTSVKGTYTSGTGGALTGDATDITMLGTSILLSLYIIYIAKKRLSD